MLLDELISKVHIEQDGVENLLIRKVRLEALLEVLQISDHAGVFVNTCEGLGLFELLNNHHLVRLLLEKHVLVGGQFICTSQNLSY